MASADVSDLGPLVPQSLPGPGHSSPQSLYVGGCRELRNLGYVNLQDWRHVPVRHASAAPARGRALTMTVTRSGAEPCVSTLIRPLRATVVSQKTFSPALFGANGRHNTMGFSTAHVDLRVAILSVRTRLPTLVGFGVCSATWIGQGCRAGRVRVRTLDTVTLAASLLLVTLT